MSSPNETTAEGAAHDPTRERILRGPLPWTVFRFGAPLALAMVLQGVFNLVDQYLVARLPAAVSDPSLDALGICDMVAAVGTILSYGVSTGTATLLAQKKGAGDEVGATRIAWASIGIVLLLGAAFGALGVLGADVIVHDLLGAKGAVRAIAVSYMHVIVGGSVTAFLMFQISSIYRALGSSRWPLAMIAGGNVLNLFLAVVMVYGPGEAPAVFSWGPPIARALGVPRMEVVGAAWATVIARSVACLLPFLFLRRRLKVAEREASLRPPRDVTRAIVDIAWPTSTQFVLRVVAVLVVISLVHHFYTTAANSDAGTAYALCLRLEMMALFISMGWGGAAQTFTGMCTGAGDLDRASRAGWVTAGYNVVTMALFALAYRAWGAQILGVFTESPRILAIAVNYGAVVSPSYAFFGVAIVLGNAIMGAGATRLALRVDAAIVGAVHLPAVIVVAAVGTRLGGLWTAIAAVNVVNAVMYFLVYRRRALWQKAPTAAASAG